MPVQPGTIPCPKCSEDRPTLISEINDPMGTRYFCGVCAHEFRLDDPPLRALLHARVTVYTG